MQLPPFFLPFTPILSTVQYTGEEGRAKNLFFTCPSLCPFVFVLCFFSISYIISKHLCAKNGRNLCTFGSFLIEECV